MDFELAMERIQAITGCRTQTELGNALGIKQSSISDAKRRQVIPDGWLVTLFRCYGANPSWILGEAEYPYLVEHLNRENPTTGIKVTSALKKGIFAYFSRQAIAIGTIVQPCSSVRITMASQAMKGC